MKRQAETDLRPRYTIECFGITHGSRRLDGSD